MPEPPTAASSTPPSTGGADGGPRRHRPRRPQDRTRTLDNGTHPSGGEGQDVSNKLDGASRSRRPRAPKPQGGRTGEPSQSHQDGSGTSGGRYRERRAQGEVPLDHGRPRGEGSNDIRRPRNQARRPEGISSEAARSGGRGGGRTPAHTVGNEGSADANSTRKPRPRRGRKFGGELTESTADAAKQDVPPAERYRSSAPKADDLTSRLTAELSTPPYPDCLICFAPITPMQTTWSCSPSHPTLAGSDDEGPTSEKAQPANVSCWMTFHLKCIKSWAVKSVKDVEDAWRARGEERQGDWRCPGCQSKRTAIPSSYWCFCGSTPDPKPPRLATPHSCANPCSRTRACGHPCSLNCHPGPCPPCQVTTSLPCYCGKETISFRCSNLGLGRRSVLASAELSCHQFCERKLGCGNHNCQELCHPGKCNPCPIRETAKCYCGKVEKELSCGEGEEKECACVVDGQETRWMGRFVCEETCERPFDCGIHHCKKPCHVPSLTPAPCPRSPKIVTHCPCSKHEFSPKSAPFFPPGTLLIRTACTDPVPTCASTCMKALEGCSHVCSSPCHTGPCPPCSIRLVRPCRCGSTTREVLCSADQAAARARARGEAGPGTEILCERPCNALRACGRHQCNRPCCPLASLAGLAKGKGKKKAMDTLEDPEGWHECDLVCGKLLNCGNHSCEERDHKGVCPPCLRSSFEEMVCHCGRTVLEPPIPCGTRMSCGYPCSRPPPECGHPKTSHACHEDPSRCPPCPYLTSKQCACGKKMVDNVRCSQEKVSCGTTCGKLLACGFHHCERLCHGDACGACHAICGKPRKLCLPAQHPCTHPCHAPASCDESEPCRFVVAITCPCGRIRQPVPCGRSLSNGVRDGSQQLKCSNECAIAKRNARLAEALGINPADRESGGRALQQVTYADELAAFARANAKFCALVEKSFADFLATEKKSQVLPHMPEQKRRFVHDLAAVYRIDTQMVDQEPHRSVQLIRRIDSRVPTPLLSVTLGGNGSGGSAGSPGLGKLADLRAPGLQPLSRPSSTRVSPAPVVQPTPGGSSGRGWTSVVARSSQPASPAPSSWGGPERVKTPVRPTPSPGPVRAAPVAAPMPVPIPAPAETPLSPQDVPDDWEDAA